MNAGRNVGCMAAKASRLLDLCGLEIFGPTAREAVALGAHEEPRRADRKPGPDTGDSAASSTVGRFAAGHRVISLRAFAVRILRISRGVYSGRSTIKSST
jgi:hypothetical protein